MRSYNKPFRRHSETEEEYQKRLASWKREERIGDVLTGLGVAALVAFVVAFCWSCDPSWQTEPKPVGNNLCQYDGGTSVFGVDLNLSTETIRCVDTEGSGR